jgi:hypothetical protein
MWDFEIPRLSASRRNFEPLAQSVEHLTFNQVVVGSIPARLTNNYKGLRQQA